MGETEAYDVVIVGAGPAGLRLPSMRPVKKYRCWCWVRRTKSSLFRAHVENMCSLFNATGQAMLETGRRQAENFGSRFLDADILRIAAEGSQFALETESGNRLACKALILATGTARNKLPVKGERNWSARG